MRIPTNMVEPTFRLLGGKSNMYNNSANNNYINFLKDFVLGKAHN